MHVPNSGGSIARVAVTRETSYANLIKSIYFLCAETLHILYCRIIGNNGGVVFPRHRAWAGR